MNLKKATQTFMGEYFAPRRRVKKTEAAYLADLGQFCEFAGEDNAIDAVTAALVSRWIKHLRREAYSVASIRRKMATLRVFCSHWVRRGQLPESPFWRLDLDLARVDSSPELILKNEVRALLAQARSVDAAVERAVRGRGQLRKDLRKGARSHVHRSKRDLALVEVLRSTGMRVSEVSGLNVGDLCLRKAVFKVYGAAGRQRLAYILNTSARRALEEYLRVRRSAENAGPALFLNASGSRLSVQGVTNILRRLCSEAGVRQVTPGMFRNSLERTLLGKRVDLRVILELLGKTSIPASGRRDPLTGEHMVGELRKVHPSLRI